MNIAIDLDSTLVKLPVIEMASAELGFNFKEEDNKDWGYSVFPVHLKQKIIEMFSDSDVMCNKVIPLEGSQRKIQEWYSKGYRLQIITARRESIRYKTVEMIQTHFPEIESVHFVGFDESKKQVLEKIAPNLFIDDAPHNVQDALDIGLNVTMISNKYTAYNHHMRNKVKWVKAIKDIEI